MALRRLTSRLNHGPLTAARGLSTLRIVAQLKMIERGDGRVNVDIRTDIRL